MLLLLSQILLISLISVTNTQQIPAACSKFYDANPSAFCQGKWKTYSLKETVQLDPTITSTYTFGKSYDIINDTLFIAHTSFTDPIFTAKLIKFDMRSGSATEFFSSNYTYQGMPELGNIHLDKNGFIYLFVQTDTLFQILKFDAKPPHSQIASKVTLTTTLNYFNNFIYDTQIDRLFLISQFNFLMINTQTLAIELNDTLLGSYEHYKASGGFFYNTDGIRVRKIDVKNMDGNVKAVNSSLGFYDTAFIGFTLVNQCVLANVEHSPLDTNFNSNLTLNLLYVDGDQGMAVQTSVPSMFSDTTINTFDGRIFGIDWSNSRVFIFDYDRS